MPSGRTHDSITLWSLPVIAGITWERTQNASVTLLLAGGYLFSGLMFGPDLDIHSQQYKRWGVLRWIWLPYRRSMRHRSVLSHGMILGTAIRVLYLGSWLLGVVGGLALLSAIAYGLAGEFPRWQQFFTPYWQGGVDWVGRSLQHHSPQWLALLLGLELGAMSHALSDWIGSRYKRLKPRPPKAPPKPSPPSPAIARSLPAPTPAAPHAPAAPPTAPLPVELPPLPPPSKRPP